MSMERTMTAVLPHSHDDASSGSPPFDHYDWLYSRGLGLRAAVALFIWWNILAFPRASLPNAWVSGAMLLVVDALAWVARRRHPQAILLWAMVTTAFDLVLGVATVTEFSVTVTSNAPALIPLIGIELIAYWGWVGYGIALGYSAVLILTSWTTPHVLVGSLSHIVFWLAVNFLIISSVALLLHRGPEGRHRAPPLTAREREVYNLLQTGLSQRDIAARLHIERSTVKTHVQHIHRKMGLDDPLDD